MSGNGQLMKKKKQWWRRRRGGTIKGEEDDGAGVEGEKRTRRGGTAAISTSNSAERNLTFLLQLHLHVYKQEWQLLCSNTHARPHISARTYVTAFISTDRTGHSKDAGGSCAFLKGSSSTSRS